MFLRELAALPSGPPLSFTNKKKNKSFLPTYFGRIFVRIIFHTDVDGLVVVGRQIVSTVLNCNLMTSSSMAYSQKQTINKQEMDEIIS